MRVKSSSWAAFGLGFVLPVLFIALILGADATEGPKTAYVGVLAVVPMLAAVFATPAITGIVAVLTWSAAFAFGQLASDGNVSAQGVRLVIIALAGLAAVGAAYLRRHRERALVVALQEAAAADQLRIQAETDQLTGLANRRGLLAHLDGGSTDVPRTIAIVDCDGLKDINDRWGHLAGDEYLRAVAGRLAGSLSRDDVIGRWGGDEFLVVQRLCLDSAMPTLARMHATVDESPIGVEGARVEGTVSIGVAAWDPDRAFDDALAAADEALYEAKALGRNRIVTAR